MFPLRTRPRGMSPSVHKTQCIFQPVLDTLGTEALKHSWGVTIPEARFTAHFSQQLLWTSICISLVFVCIF